MVMRKNVLTIIGFLSEDYLECPEKRSMHLSIEIVNYFITLIARISLKTCTQKQLISLH